MGGPRLEVCTPSVHHWACRAANWATVHRSATRVWCPLQVFKFSLYLAVPACLTAAVVLRQDVLQAIIKSVSLL